MTYLLPCSYYYPLKKGLNSSRKKTKMTKCCFLRQEISDGFGMNTTHQGRKFGISFGGLLLLGLTVLLSQLPSSDSFSTLSSTITSSQSILVSSVDQSIISSSVRPLEQNWWPVVLKNTLNVNGPNSIELLGKKLVVWRTKDDEDEWSCLDDVCAHRFAPLSEGRIIPHKDGSTQSNCLQCAYHGWEFASDGECIHIPQVVVQKQSATRNVQNYPVRIAAEMLWVWADPSSYDEQAKLEPLPISPLLQRAVAERMGDGFGFMRDLPYGYELLGENLLDLSHLPFSHHGIGSLNRDKGGPVPFRSLSVEERKQVCIDEQQQQQQGVASLLRPALFQGALQDAHVNDPILKSMKPSPNATCLCGFYEPSHVRYYRVSRPGAASTVELFLCPTSAGKSRVILFNVAQAFLPSAKNQDLSIRGKIQSFIDAKKKAIILQKFFSSWQSHMINHAIFDGDGIFLHKQGDRMYRNNLTFRDYFTPTSADILVNMFRRYLEAATKKSMDNGSTSAALAASGANNNSSSHVSIYKDNLQRSDMLERYNSHTKTCKICSAEVKKLERKRELVEFSQSVLQGSTGASLALAVLSIASRNTNGGIQMLRASAVAFSASLTGTLWARKKLIALVNTIQKFYFVDYVHQEKK